MALRLHEIERGIGIDLLRRPVLVAFLNAFLLQLFADAFLHHDDEEEEKVKYEAPKAGWAKSPLTEKLAATSIFFLAHLLMLVGFAESVGWALIAIVFKVLKLPRVYVLEKLLLDLRVMFLKPSVRYVKKTIRFQCRPGQKIPRLQTTRRGFGVFVITIVSSVESITRDTAALLHMLRYMNYPTYAYWTDDSVLLIGINRNIERALCNLASEPAVIDLGWHKDVIESTNLKVEAVFTKENLRRVDSGIQSVGRRAVVVEIAAEFTTLNLETLVKSMSQYAAVCEAHERGIRLFNGKRLSIYAVGLFVSLALIVFYEGLGGLLKPSADVLTLAVGAYTLWMTVGKSAALGETEERTSLSTYNRENVLLAYHGLAHIEENVINICWVPEVHRDDHESPLDAEAVDGSISVLEAGIFLNIFEHFGHFVKWKGPRLQLDRMKVVAGDDPGVAHIVSVDRMAHLNMLGYQKGETFVKRLGGVRYVGQNGFVRNDTATRERPLLLANNVTAAEGRSR
ncbi:hypothetical protein BWQ96_08485 [Gracilariopsis chorda]|uniref:Uncharacterized protein n=1 Tax=Gracilariopsis chorda TaxID=448386 RepID=A0A2V3II95_9FLOR|nr:hypothetical protein BWQ96_08485 [Gracilariopsis chorda]|eukprot:PXF41791.1 hypothetical protein BWQ96_08485 [Gracilariopsis chorda]